MAADRAKQLVIGIGDLHGHYGALDHLLTSLDDRHGIFDDAKADKLHREVTLVFTGDYIDRGGNALGIISRLTRLSQANPGRVMTLLGNHEVMALESYDLAVELARSDSESAALSAYGSQTNHGSNGGMKFIGEFASSDSGAALGNYVERMARTGDVGLWMRSLLPWYDATIAGKRILFVHGDLPSRLLQPGALHNYQKELVRALQASSAAIGTEQKYGHPWLSSSAGFFWNRSFSDLEGASDQAVASICDAAGADYIVTGHTMHSAITPYCNRIFDIDVGMYRGNMPQALLLSEKGILGFRSDGLEQGFVANEGAEA